VSPPANTNIANDELHVPAKVIARHSRRKVRKIISANKNENAEK